jgi:hypothetical protein
MSTRLLYVFLSLILLTAFSSCYVVNFSKDFEFEMIYEVNTDSTILNESYMQDATVYESFEELVGYVESVEINSISCKLTAFNGSDDQSLNNGLLKIGDENKTKLEILGTIPNVLLKDMFNSEKYLDLNQAGKDLAEELILKDPHVCLGIMTGNVSSSPADFTLKFRFSVTVTGSLL